MLGQVFWLWDRSTSQAFPETFGLPVAFPEFRPPLQRRDRMGIAPISLFAHDVIDMGAQTVSIATDTIE